jgi:hypothetical protein
MVQGRDLFLELVAGFADEVEPLVRGEVDDVAFTLWAEKILVGSFRRRNRGLPRN